MPHTISAYQCDYCHRAFERKVDAVNHECACKYNPARRTCYTCKHYQEREYTRIEPGYFIGEEDHEVTAKGYICTKWNMPIHDKPYYKECETTDDTYTEPTPVPGTCWHYEPKENK